MTRRKPCLLDLFCKAGGCTRGYQQAGFHVTGVDIDPQPRYVGDAFRQADAMGVLQDVEYLRRFDVIHASPPCQAYSVTRSLSSKKHPELIPEVRRLLRASGCIYIIENVPGAPLEWPVVICGLALDLRVKRHRLFESNVMLFGTTCPAGHRDAYVTVAGHDMRLAGKFWASVHGGAPARGDTRRRADAATARLAMGIDWMTRDELSQAIPPAYTEHLGRQLIRILENQK